MSRPIKTLFKVKIFVNNEFVSYGEFVKEGEYFSLVSNYKVFDGHINEDLKNFDYIFSFNSYNVYVGKTFDEIVETINNYNEEGFWDEKTDSYVYPEFFLIEKKTKTKFDEIEL